MNCWAPAGDVVETTAQREEKTHGILPTRELGQKSLTAEGAAWKVFLHIT
jgi:hypothetical protein